MVNKCWLGLMLIISMMITWLAPTSLFPAPVVLLPEREATKPGSVSHPAPVLFERIGQEGPGLVRPMGAAVTSNGNIYVADEAAGQVRVFDRNGRYLMALGSDEEAGGAKLRPSAVAVDGNDRVIVGDFIQRQLLIYNSRGKLLERLDPNNTGLPLAPLALATDAQNRIYIANRTGEVLVLDDSGQLLLRYGRPGSEPGYLAYPNGIAVSHDGLVYVSDSGNGRLQVFDHQGDLLAVLLSSLIGVAIPRGIALDREGRLYLADVLEHRVVVLSPDLHYLFSLGDRMKQDQQIAFSYPTAVALDARGLVYVTDREHAQVTVWGY